MEGTNKERGVMLGDSSLASTGKVVTTAIKHGGHSIFGYVFHVPPPGYLRPSVNRARNIKRLFDIRHLLIWIG